MTTEGYLLGLDIGSSSIKASLLDAASGTAALASASSPDSELEIIAPQPGWAEQHPDTWWQHVVAAVGRLRSTARVDLADVRAVGIAYQMHGLVLVDRAGAALRNAIIWCDSRAVALGEQAAEAIGRTTCLQRMLNSPGNFTASKLKWVMENEPALFAKVDKFMLPGDYIALRLTGSVTTTASGLSEGVLWDVRDNAPAALLLDHYGIDPRLLPTVVPTFAVQGQVGASAAQALGLKPGTPVAYRAGDQPNNAFSLKVLQPGEVAATAGTSGVVYGVLGAPSYDPQSRVNTFVHVNHSAATPRYGMLLCVNGTGILNSWLKRVLGGEGNTSLGYDAMNRLAASAPPGSAGLMVLPYGNGAERTLLNRNIGASLRGLQLTLHGRPHLARAVQEGIVFALKYGLDIMHAAGLRVTTVRAGHANMFLSPVFREAFATVCGATLELYNTDGSQGAARGAGLGAGIYHSPAEAFGGLAAVEVVEPSGRNQSTYEEAYRRWTAELATALAGGAA